MPIHTLMRGLRRLRAILNPNALNDDMQAEMREHIARATERLIARGMSADDARIAAKREFGNATVIQYEARDVRGAQWIDSVRGDLRFAFRYFARHKATVAIIFAVLALGTGANAMIFSTFQSEFLRPAPAVPDDNALARVWARERATTTARWELRGFTYPELQALANHREIFVAVAAWTADDVIFDGGDSTGARGVAAQFVTSNYFAALGVPLAAGQGFARDASDTPDMVAVMAYATAEQLYGRPASAMGRRIMVNEIPLRIVGVAPPRFQGAVRKMDEPALWIPLSARADIARISARWLVEQPSLSLFARLAPKASRDQATALTRQIVTHALPDSATRVGMARTAQVLSMLALPPGENEMILAVTLIMTIGALILLVAWTNVSSLMVAAAVGRRHEIAVRLSLGATRARLLRQLVTESTVLALAGGAAGLTLAWWFLAYKAKTEIHEVDIVPDVGTCVFVLVIALACGVLFGLSPALHATRGGVANAMRDSGKSGTSRSRLQRAFVVAQIVLSQPLLVLLGTMLSLVVAEYRPLSPEMSSRVISVGLRPLAHAAPGQRDEAVDSLVPGIASRPEVLSAVPDVSAFAIRGIVAGDRNGRAARADSAPTVVHLEAAAPGWFALVDVPIMLGRDVALADSAAANRPVVIGSDLARKLWGNENPIGRTLASPIILPGQDSISMTVVGVYDATRRMPGMTWNGGTARTDAPARIFTARDKQWRHDRILVRTRGPAAPFLPELERFIRAKAPSLPVTGMRTLAQADEQVYRDTVQMAALAGAGGALALLLASLGLYGVVSLSVQQRTREIGIRIAVGALPMQVARMFLASGVRVSGLALILGLPLSVAALHVALLQGLVIAPGVNPYVIGSGIAMLLLAVAAAATWLPARRAAMVDPATTLRQE